MSPLAFDAPWALLLLPPALLVALWFGRSGRGRISPRRFRTVRVLRPVSVVLVVLALAGLELQRREERLTVIFAVDGSRSVGGAGNTEAANWLAAAGEGVGEGDQAGVVAFGREAMIDTFPGVGFSGAEVLARPGDDATDVAAAVRLARGLFPPLHEKRLVILSDGVETAGSVEQAAVALPEEIDVLWAPLAVPPVAEVLVEQLSVPARVVEGEPHRVRVVLRASQATEATLRLYRGSVPVAAAPVRLAAGSPQVFSFDQVTPSGARNLLYRVRVETPGDATPENNRATALVEVTGKPAILVVDREPQAVRRLVTALETAGMKVSSAGPGALPADVRGLAAYDSVVLSDVAASHFSDAQLAALKTWVQDLGGGLLALGGPEGFGRGGYWQTPVEDVLPVAMEVKDHSYFPSVGLVLCIDKSGSMAGTSEIAKIEMAKTAAAAVADLLQPMDSIGVVAFDYAAKWIVPMTSGDDARTIRGQLGYLRAGGGTDAYPAMQEAYEALQGIEARVKHVIVLTDGMLQARDHEGLAQAMLAAGVTVSTVAVGTDADLYTLERIADAGGGGFHHAVDVEKVPRIFLRDAFRVARSWLVEETFVPVPSGTPRHAALGGLDPAALPPLDGYVAASEKAGGEHLLATHLGDPLLSVWRIGLGKSVAFTSDAKSRWSSRWLGWEGYGPFWAALVRWTLRDQASSGRFRVAAEASGGRLRIAADLLDSGGAFVNGAGLRARVVGPDGRSREVTLTQEGPGRYEGEVEAERQGPYLAAVVRDDGGATPQEGATVSAVVPYADEFRGLGRAPDAMERLAASGRVRHLTDAEEIFRHRGTGGRIRWPLAPALLAAAAFLLLVEVAVRKLALPEWAERRRAAVPAEARITALRAARRRATRHVRAEAPAAEPAFVEDAVTPPPAPPVPESESPPVAEEGGYTSRLLAAKKRSRQQ